MPVGIAVGSIFRWLVIPYSPRPTARGFLDAAVAQQRDGLEVRVAALDNAASREFFAVPMARRGIQPVWVQVVNRTGQPYRLQFLAIDPNYFSRSRPRASTITKSAGGCSNSASWRGCSCLS